MRRDVCVAVTIFGLLAALVFIFPAGSPQAATGSAPPNLTVVVTGETRAALEDCG